jgi:hypothetical protein
MQFKVVGVKLNFFSRFLAGPGFDSVIDLGDHSLAAQNVQCKKIIMAEMF